LGFVKGTDVQMDDAALLDAVQCPSCGGRVRRSEGCLRCDSCGQSFAIDQGVLCLVPTESIGGPHGTFYSADDFPRYGRDKAGMPPATVAQVRTFLASVEPKDLVVEVGSGQGAFAGVHPNYVATDISLVALQRFCSGPRLQADAGALPLVTGVAAAIFSVATLEHLPNPEAALGEIDRCLRPGGRALISAAWYVRPWAASGLHVTRYSELSAVDRLRKATILVRNRRPYQAALVMPGRIRREYALRRGVRLGLDHWKLEPNLSEYLVSDSDASVRVDPHAVSAFFVSRGYRDLRRRGPSQRLRYGYEPVIVEKPSR
jgi:SAM-dependent methyltransferase/uncharacterized protein YbaR (Trm112 family)